jgi:hypothetical protein
MNSYRLILICFVLLFAGINAHAQYATLVLNYEKSCFGENEPLPAMKFFVVTGVANADIPYV